MKFACVMVTRGRPKRAAAVIESAKTLASGDHEIEFVICCDDDDLATQEEFKGFRLSIAPTPIALGEIWNRGARELDGDVICPFPDDSFVGCTDWDARIVSMLAKLPKHGKLLGWNDTANPNLMTLPVIGREWYEVAGFYPGLFPYWFEDTWIAEVYSFVTGRVPHLPKDLLLVAKKGKTQRMRDLGFWWEFYTKLRPERLKEAERIRDHFGVPATNLNQCIDHWTVRDLCARSTIPTMEMSMADDANQMPSERYMQIKRAAEEKLMTL